MNTLQIIKYIWITIKPFFIDFTYLIYLFIFILIFKFLLYIFKNKFDISKPIILSIIEGFLYLLFIIILVIDILQLAFKIPLINILENDIDRQYNEHIIGKDTTPPTDSCININTFKDPQAVRSFYDLQMSAYDSMKEIYGIFNDIVDDKTLYQPNIENPYSNGYPDNTQKSVNIPKSQFDANVNKTLKYWMDNSSNIMSQVNI
jgi:hypothetical protein